MSTDRKTSLLRDRSARRAVKRAYRMCVTRSSSLRITCGSISSSRCQTTCAAAIFRSPRCEFGFHGQVPTGVSNFDPRSTRIWWSQTGSNRRPPACKAGALPTELWPLRHAHRQHEVAACTPKALPKHLARVVGLGRFELPTSRLSSARSNQLSYKPKTFHKPKTSRSHGRPNLSVQRKNTARARP